MRGVVSATVGISVLLAAFSATAATKAPAKGPPACGAITFRPLPAGMPDGEQQAGMYKSRHARLELKGDVKQGNPVDYYVTSAGKRVATAPANLPEEAAKCAAAKKMPKPEAPSSACTGQRFRVLVAHAGNQRLSLLYAEEGAGWRFCSAGTF